MRVLRMSCVMIMLTIALATSPVRVLVVLLLVPVLVCM